MRERDQGPLRPSQGPVRPGPTGNPAKQLCPPGPLRGGPGSPVFRGPVLGAASRCHCYTVFTCPRSCRTGSQTRCRKASLPLRPSCMARLVQGCSGGFLGPWLLGRKQEGVGKARQSAKGWRNGEGGGKLTFVRGGRDPVEAGHPVPQQRVGGKGAVGRDPREGGGQRHREAPEEGLRLHPGSLNLTSCVALGK